MNFDSKDKETNSLQAAAVNIKSIVEIYSLDSQRRCTMPLEAWRRWHPENGKRGLLREESLCQGLSPDISGGSLRQHRLNEDVTCWHFTHTRSLIVKDYCMQEIFCISNPKFSFQHSKRRIYFDKVFEQLL